MDIVYLLLALVLALITAGFLRLCDRLGRQREPRSGGPGEKCVP
ncbi:MAG TPA: hypothetical protein VGU03_06170 [Frateuria sp.]|nr:hypothetical protein [Frateuria sp.]